MILLWRLVLSFLDELLGFRFSSILYHTEHATPILRQLHWFPVQKRICHKILSATYRSVQENTPSASLIFSIDTPLLAFSDQHLDLSLMFPSPGIPRQSGTASEPSGMS